MLLKNHRPTEQNLIEIQGANKTNKQNISDKKVEKELEKLCRMRHVLEGRGQGSAKWISRCLFF